MRLNKDNVINSFCIFVLVTTMCVIITIVLKLFFRQEIEIGFVKDIFSIGSTLAAALIAVALFSNWKDQAKHSLSRQNIEDILKTFSISKKNLRTGISIITDINMIDEYAIFKERYNNINYTENSNLLTELDFKFKILDDLYKDKFCLFESFAEIERHFNTFNQLLIEISLSYNSYYKLLKKELENIHNSRLLTWNYINQIKKYDFLDIDQGLFVFEINKLSRLSSGEIGYKVYKDPVEEYKYNNPRELIDKCIELIESIENILISEILPKE